ncbi:MAG TPA: trimeric intracellular cation channel family protein [Chitinophagaceae bacterium]|jgi:uncharacterized membrane protein YeiH|nr:trimeric intracellular cation channel family protein [Chitinophagaceae bacterium]
MEFSFLHIIDILGTFSFAAAGAFAAMEKKLDAFGVLIISFATAIGGGTVRDVLLGRLPVAWLTNSTAIWVILIGAAAALFFSTLLQKLYRLLFYFDAMGLGLFTMLGIQTAMEQQLSTGICIMLGTVSGCFGGVLRDVLLNNVPLIFHKEIYASASILGGIVFFILLRAGMPADYASLTGIIIVFSIRVLAVRFSWSLPKMYSPK